MRFSHVLFNQSLRSEKRSDSTPFELKYLSAGGTGDDRYHWVHVHYLWIVEMDYYANPYTMAVATIQYSTDYVNHEIKRKAVLFLDEQLIGDLYDIEPVKLEAIELPEDFDDPVMKALENVNLTLGSFPRSCDGPSTYDFKLYIERPSFASYLTISMLEDGLGVPLENLAKMIIDMTRIVFNRYEQGKIDPKLFDSRWTDYFLE